MQWFQNVSRQTLILDRASTVILPSRGNQGKPVHCFSQLLLNLRHSSKTVTQICTVPISSEVQHQAYCSHFNQGCLVQLSLLSMTQAWLFQELRNPTFFQSWMPSDYYHNFCAGHYTPVAPPWRVIPWAVWSNRSVTFVSIPAFQIVNQVWWSSAGA